MARLRPLTQQSLERGWCPSVSGRARSTSQLLVEVRVKTSTATCSDFGYLPQFVWILGPLLERALRQVDPLRTPGSWWRLSALQTDTAVSKYDRAAFAHAYVEASRVRFRTCAVLSVAVDDSRVEREPWNLGAVLDPVTNFAAWLLAQTTG